MLRRAPVVQTKNGDPVPPTMTGAGYGIPSFKPFKTPALATTRQTALPPRKRKRVSYKGAGGDDDDEGDSDASEGKVKKGKTFEMGNKEYGADGVLGDMAKWCNRKFPVFKVKEKAEIFHKRWDSSTIKS
jgi:DNA repair and recombination RAD54-like protein